MLNAVHAGRELGCESGHLEPFSFLGGASSGSACARVSYTEVMKNITLSADEALIERGRRRAEHENTTLNNLFREWLASYVGAPRLSLGDVRRTAAAVPFRAGRSLIRDERNER